MLNDAFNKYDPSQVSLYVYDVWKTYNGVKALNGISLYVKRGEILGLIGPNGSGKTTTIKIILGLIKKDKGVVNVLGYDIDKEPFKYKQFVGYVPEAALIPEYLTAYEFLYYVGRIKNVPGDVLKDKIDSFISLFGLMDKKKDLIISLSKGMKQKLIFLSSIIYEPKLLLLDEPFIGLDPEGQYEIKSILKELSESGCSILLSTHLLDFAERFCDRVAIINKGKNIATGDLEYLKKRASLGEDTTLEQIFLTLTKEQSLVSKDNRVNEEGRNLFKR
ncbi:MAG: ABC transporter ATP-binding protein [Nitrososphaeria archaeon]|nr:ABC transporter ATP-binding protein [Nitrososphaeria archaeon]